VGVLPARIPRPPGGYDERKRVQVRYGPVGLWNRILDALTGSASAAPREPDGATLRQATAGSVAVAERPEDSGGDSTATPRGNGVAGAELPPAPAPQAAWYAPPEGTALLEPAPVEPPETSSQARALENALVQQFDGHDLSLPPLPRSADRVLRKMREKSCGAAEIADEIADDQVMAAEVIRIANSALYRGLNKISAIRPAVARMGVEAIRTLMLHQSLKAATFGRKGVDEELAAVLWYRSVAAAHVMRRLAALTGVDPEDAFLLGLLHDIGNVLVLREAESQRHFANCRIDIDTFEYICFQTHQEFGELIATEWKLPKALTAVISDHHRFPEPDDPHRTHRLMILLADMINQVLGYGVPASYDLLHCRPAVELLLADTAPYGAFLDALPSELEDVLTSFGIEAGLQKRLRKGASTLEVLHEWLSSIRLGRMQDKRKLGQRRAPRWTVTNRVVAVRVDGDPTEHEVPLLDASAGGIAFLFPMPLPTEHRVWVLDKRRGMQISGRVANSAAKPNEQGMYRVGIALKPTRE